MPLFERPLAMAGKAPANAAFSRRTANTRTVTGKIVDAESALTVPVVLAVITILAEDISSLPLITYRRKQPRGKEPAVDFYLYPLLHDAPNDEHTSMIFRELIVSHMIGWGNFYAQKIVNNAGQLMELWPLNPSNMRVSRDPSTQRRIYQYTPSGGGRPIDFTQDEIWHIPGFGFDGLQGFSKITLMRNAIALSMSTEEFGGRFFENDARPGFVLKHPKLLSDKAYERLSQAWDDDHLGSENSHKKAILEEGLDIATIGIPLEDAQFLETRKFQVSEFARALRIPPHLVGDVERSTSWGSGIEQQELGYKVHTLQPWTIRIEQQANKDLMLAREAGTYYVKHNFDGMLRGDITARFNSYSIGIDKGIINPNEARDKEDMDPYDGGDTYRAQVNTAPIGTGTGADNGQPQSKMQAFTPIALDAAARCLRREAHDLVDAARKFARRQDVAGMQTWLLDYYATDHNLFAARQFEPVARGMMATAGVVIEGDILNAALCSFFEGVHEFHAEIIGSIIANIPTERGIFQVVVPKMIDTFDAQIPALEKLQSGTLTEEFLLYMQQRLEIQNA